MVVKINAGKESESNVRLSAYEDLFDTISNAEIDETRFKKGEGRMLDFNFVNGKTEGGTYSWNYLSVTKIFSEYDITEFLSFLNTRYSCDFNTYRNNNWKMIIFNLSLEKECWNDLIAQQPSIEKITWTDKNKFTVTLVNKLSENDVNTLQRDTEIFGNRNQIDIEVEDGKMVVKHEISYPKHCEN